ncbi:MULTISPECIES: LCP family protein [Bifidobacterium]|uniref:LCP family protein n=1 Tax=Bifidobacterium TaxID=1678 RepID=UPI001BDDAFAE|nr:MULTISPECIES: LCP family protein [Bifidobacterium]MBT1162423.1 LCP family protein [Bifidobacterium sp. SO1]MBW3078310.1 LCP family protein [Bifidobacterium simiiventris]
MIDGNGGMHQATPPSFTPAGSRRRPSQDRVQPSAQPSDQVPSDAGAAGTQHPAIPPSFSPSSAKRRSAARPTGAAAVPPSATVRRTSAPAQPESVVPVSAAAEQPHSFSPAVPRQPRRSASGSRVSTVASHVSAAPSRVPQTQPRTPMMPAAPSVMGKGTGASRRLTERHIGRLPQGPGTGVTRAKRRLHAGRIVFGVFAVLLAALVLLVFGAWNWVDGRIGRDQWLTSMADSSGATSWLLVGSDKRDNTEGVVGSDDATVTGFRTDTLLVLTKPKNGPSSLISIPRDSLVEVEGQYMKINSVAQVYGNKALTGEVEQITGQKIDHVAEIQFGGLKNVVDAVGGVNLCYDQDVDDGYSGLQWQAGCHDADGTTALAFSRMRYSDAQGDFGRAARQRQVIAAVMKKALSAGTLLNPAKVMALANAGLSSITVDESTDPATLAAMALAFRDATGSGGVTGSLYWSNPDYYVDGVGSSVLLDDSANLELFSQLASGKHATGEVGTLAES